MITTTEGGNPSLQNNIITAVHFLSVGRMGFWIALDFFLLRLYRGFSPKLQLRVFSYPNKWLIKNEAELIGSFVAL